jgi:hypothetical protein
MWEVREFIQNLVEDPERKRPLREPRCRWEDTVNFDIKEIEWDDDWIHLAQVKDQ